MAFYNTFKVLTTRYPVRAPSTKAYSAIYVPRRTRQLYYGRFGEGGGDNGESKMLFEGGRHGALTGYLVSLFFGVGVTTTRPSRNARLALEKGLRVVRDPDDGGDAARKEIKF